MGNPEETEPEPPKDNNSIEGTNETSEQSEASQDSHITEASQNPDPELEGNSSEQYYPPTSESASMPPTSQGTPSTPTSSPATPQNFNVPSTSASQSYSSTAQVFNVPRSSPTAPSHYSPSVQLYDLDRAGPSTSSESSQYRQRAQASDITRSTAGPSTSQNSPEMELYDLDQAGPSTPSTTHYSYDIVNPSEGPSTSRASQFNYDVYQSPQGPGTSPASSNVAKCQMFEVPETNKFKKPRPPMPKTAAPKSALEMATPEMIEKMTCGSVSNLPANRNLRDESDVSGEEGDVNGIGGSQPRPGTKVYLDQERFLPIANVVRIMKSQMDPQAKLAKDAKECVQECVSEFICFIASEAAALCAETKRKTITADDLLTALEATGFNNFAEPMRIFLQKYRQQHKITGPIHRVHPNYCRPKQFLNDPPVPPLFFDSPNGRRGTETQYVTNGHEIIKTAPFHTEWNELTGMPNTDEREEEEEEVEEVVQYIEQDQIEPMEEMEMEDDGMEQDPLGGIALEQQGQMQIYVDPKSKQHYAAKETPNGMELYPLIIQDTPLQLESVPVPSFQNFVINTEEEPVIIQRGVHMAPSPDMNTAGPSNPRKRQNPAPHPVRRNRQLDDEEDDEEELDDDLIEEVPVQYHREQYTVQYRRPQNHQQQQHRQQQPPHHHLNNHPQRHRPPQHHQQQAHQPQVQESRFEAIQHPEDVIPPRVLPQPPHRSLPRAVPQKATPQRAAAAAPPPRRAVPPRVASQKTTPPKPATQKTPPKRSPAKRKK